MGVGTRHARPGTDRAIFGSIFRAHIEARIQPDIRADIRALGPAPQLTINGYKSGKNAEPISCADSST